MKSRSAREFRLHPYPKPELVINPWFPTPSVVMLFAKAGSGKTYVTLGFALSLAAGWPLLDFSIPKPKRVLYVDGEMPAPHQQIRLEKLQKAHKFPEWAWDNLFVLSQTDFESGIPDLAPMGSKGRKLIEDEVEMVKADVIILDNYSTLFKSGDDNAVESFQGANQWMLGLRRKGYAILLIDHAGKEGDGKSRGPRGSSKKTDIADCVIELKQKEVGAQYPITWKYQKVRHFQPDKGNAGFQFLLNFRDNDSECMIQRTDSKDIDEEVEDYQQRYESGDISRATYYRRKKQRNETETPGRIKKVKPPTRVCSI